MTAARSWPDVCRLIQQRRSRPQTPRPDPFRPPLTLSGRLFRPPLRAERLAPIERVVESARQWLGQRLGIEPAVTQRQSAREFIAQAQREAQRQSQSRGIRM